MGEAVEANLALTRRGFELWNTGGLQALVDHVWAPDVVYHEAPELPDGGVFRGAEAVAARTRALVEAVGHFQYDVRALEGRGEHVLAAIDLSAEGADSGAALTRTFFYVVWLREGRFRELRAYGDADQARREYERLAVAPSD